MESTERLVRTWMASGRDEEIAETVSEINKGSTTLLNVVKALGEYLTSEEDKLRTKGVEFLSSVLGRCPPEKLNRQSVRVLASFYCSKTEDWDTIVPALQGLVHLTTLPTCTEEEAHKIIDSMFEHVKMKSLVQSVRYNVFTIIDNIMARHRDVLKSMGPEFLGRYVVLVEGEKDPRNLLIAFAIARVLAIEFDISNHVEASNSLFNITFCYFPITFRPPPNDPYGITTDDLRLALRHCLSATPLYGPLAIPLFLEKLAAGSPVTKRDTLETMSVCFPVYGAPLARSNARKLWNALKLEIFQPIDPKTEEQALKTTQDLVKLIYSDGQQADVNIEGLAKDACEECLMILREPEKSQAKHAIKVLCAFMSTTPSVSRYTIAQVIPYLMKQFVNPEDASARPSVLLLVSDVIAAVREAISHTPDKETSDSEQTETPLTPYKDELVSVVISGLKVPSCRSPAIACLLGLVSIPELLAEEELEFIVHNVNEVLEDEGDEEDSSAALKLLSTIAASTPRLIRDLTLPRLFSNLPDQAPPKDAVTERVKYWRTLAALTALCRQPELFEILVIRLSTRLDLLCFRNHPNPPNATTLEPDAAYAHSMLHTIHKVLVAKIDDGHPDVAKYIDVLVPRLFNLFISSAILSAQRYNIGVEPRLITAAGQITTLIVQSLPVARQETYVQALFSAFIDGNVKPIAEGQQPVPADYVFRPFDPSSSGSAKNLVVLFSSAVVALHKEIRVPVPDLNLFLNDILDWSLDKADQDDQREAAWKMITAISNKRIEDAAGFLSDKLERFWSTRIADIGSDLPTRQRAIQAWGWAIKALLVRVHPLCGQFTDRLFELFAEEGINWHAAKTFGDIVSIDKVLTKRNHAVIKILHTQRFVDGVLPRLISGAKNSANSHEQFAHLVALCSLISQISRTLYGRELPSLIPLLIRGLDLPDHNIRCKVIDTLLAVAQEDSSDKSAISEHAPSLVTTMLRNSIARDMPSANVRISALKYLGVLPKVVRYDVLHPHKASIIRELSLALDDPKRLVRKEAVETRTAWFKFNG